MTNIVRILTSVDGNAGKELKTLRDGWETFQKKGAQGLAIGVGITAAAKGFDLLDTAVSTGIGLIGDSITKASDLNETMSKAEVIFGANSKAVEDWAATMDKAGGLSKKAALDTASGFAGLFKTVGIGIDEATAKSEKLTQLGSDLASFFNTDVGTALDALKSGLDGEAKPLRQFNIFLSETAVSAKLASMGVKKVGGEFTEAQKATARYQLILDQTGDAQGDFARTSDGLANSQRVTAAEVDNLQAEIGQELLPIVRDLSNWAKDEGVPALHELFDTFKEAGPAVDFVLQGFNDLDRDLNGVSHNVNGAGISIHNWVVGLFGASSAATDAAAATRDLGYEVDNSGVSMATLGDHADRAASNLSSLGSELGAANVTMATLGDHSDRVGQNLDKTMATLADHADRVAQNLDSSGVAAKRTADAFHDLTAEGHDLGYETDYLSSSMAGVEDHGDRVANNLDHARVSMATLADHADRVAENLDGHRGVAAALAAVEDHGDRVATSLGSADRATTYLTSATKDLHRAYAPVITDERTVKQQFDDATTAIEDQMFAVDALKRSMQEHSLSLQDDIKHLHDLEAIKHPTRAQREDILATKDAIADDKKATIEAAIKLAEMGKISFAQLKKQLHDIGFNLDGDTQAAKDLRLALLAADQAANGRAGHGGGGGGTGVHKTAPPPVVNDRNHATGGLAKIGDKGWVGELGPERYDVTSAGVMFESTQQSMASRSSARVSGGAAAGGLTINIYGVSVLTPSAADRLAQQLGPHVTKWQQDHRLIGAR